MEATKTNVQKAWAFVVRHAKEHHESVNAAVGVYYPHSPSTSPAVSPLSTAAPSRRPSEGYFSDSASSRRSSLDKIWDGVKKHAKEHHESVNSAYSTYYSPRS